MAVGADMSVALGRSRIVHVAPLTCCEWPVLRSMRGAALRDAPSAFVTTWATERRLPVGHWQSRFVTSTWVAARDETKTVGIACLAPPDADAPRAPFVESVWVRPIYRWQGVLRQMLDRLEFHAREADSVELRLWVLETNESACSAYQKLGFGLVVGVTQDTAKLRQDGTPVKEQLMSKSLL